MDIILQSHRSVRRNIFSMYLSALFFEIPAPLLSTALVLENKVFKKLKLSKKVLQNRCLQMKKKTKLEIF